MSQQSVVGGNSTASSRPNTAGSVAEEVEDIQDLTTELALMQKKERDLLAALSAINDAFFDLGVPISTSFVPSSVSEEKSKEVSLKGYHPDKLRKYGIRMSDELSFRGRDKAKEYFEDILDMDKDGFIDYEESRAVHAFRHPYGLIHDASHQSRYFLYYSPFFGLVSKMKKRCSSFSTLHFSFLFFSEKHGVFI